MSLTLKTGGTYSGGSNVVFSQAGVTPGKSVYVGPNTSRLVTERIEFTSSSGGANADSLGTARAGVKITLSNRTADEGCCTVKQGSVIIDLGFRWDLNQSSTYVDEIMEHLRSLVFSTEFGALLEQGRVPTA